MTECDWCGKPINNGEAFSEKVSPICYGNSEGQVIELTPEYEVKFCCMGCYWAFSLDFHRILGMSAKEARRHIIETEDITPAKANGRQSVKAWNRSRMWAEHMARILYGYHPDTN
jgi:hypothetical protein